MDYGSICTLVVKLLIEHPTLLGLMMSIEFRNVALVLELEHRNLVRVDTFNFSVERRKLALNIIDLSLNTRPTLIRSTALSLAREWK